MNRLNLFCCGLVTLFAIGPAMVASGQTLDVWIGTGRDDGIFHLTLDTERGRMSQPTKMDSLGGAGFLSLSPDGKTLYASAQIDPQSDAGVASYRIEGQGRKRRLERTGFVATGDGRPACVAVDATGMILFSAQYGGGSTTSYSLSAEDGSVVNRVSLIEHGEGSKVDARRQAAAHPHWVGTSPDNQYLLVPDLGRDEVVSYRVDLESGKLQPHQSFACPPGAGPRHMKFHPDLDVAYVLNELSLTISVFDVTAAPLKLSPIQEIETLPDSEKTPGFLDSAAEIRIHPSGRFLYASNRGHDTIAIFEIDRQGKLCFIDREPIRGSIPRNFNLSPDGKWLIAAGQQSNTLALFQVSPETGRLTFVRQVVNVPQPICVEFGKP